MSRSEKSKNAAKRIVEACDGLIFMSETDAAVRPVFVGKSEVMTPDILLRLAGARSDAAVTETSIEDFFSKLTKDRPWHTPEQRRNANRFAALWKVLNEELCDLRVFRVGRIRIEIYVIGRDEDRNWQGIKTLAVET